MSFFTDASFVMDPNVYGVGKLYVPKPTDGSGDLTFSRASTGTRVNQDGLIEKVRTNSLLQSNQFDTTWTTSNANVTSGQAGYDGTNNAWEVNASASGGGILQSNTQSGSQTFSVYAKGSVSTGIRLYAFGSVNAFAYFNLNTGALGSVSSGVSAKIEAVGGGWYRCSISFDQTNTTLRFYTTDNNNANAAGIVYIQNAQLETGDVATEYIPTTTSAVSVGPLANIPRLNYGSDGCPSLLLEPSATALNQFSEQLDNAYYTKADVTISANTTDTLDPSGYYGADKITETATTARHRLLGGSITMSAVNNTSSVFMKKGTARYGFVTMSGAATSTIVVDLEDGTITDTSTSGTIVAQKVDNYANGWYRISVTALGISGATSANLQFGSAGSATPTYSANVPIYAGSTSNYLYAWGANITNTSYLQSYIPTLSTAVTRVAESCSKISATALIGQTEGTIYTEVNFSKLMGTVPREWFIISDANTSATSDWVTVSTSGAGTNLLRARIAQSGTIKYDKQYTIPAAGVYKMAFAYKSGDCELYVNGSAVGTVATNSAFTLSMDRIITSFTSGTFELGDGLNQALVFKTRLSNTDLARLTSL